MPRLLICMSASLSLITSATIGQTTPPPQQLNSTQSSTAQSYWTPNRMMQAKPRGMPQHNGSAVNPTASTPRVQNAPQNGASQQGQAGSPPTIPDSELDGMAIRKQSAQTPAQWRSLGESPDASSEPTANSTYGFPFTTSEVQNAEQTRYPFRASGRLYFTETGVGDFICSGSTIRPGIVVVAGHCVAAPQSGNTPPHYFTNFMFIPAYNNGDAPYGTWYPAWVGTTGEWFNGDNTVPNAQDVGMFAMREQNSARIGDVVGWYGWQTNSLSGQHITMLGYPCNLDNCSTMIRTDAGNSVAGGKDTYEYGSAGSGGYSGGPWLIDFGTNPTNTGVKSWPLGTNTVVAVTSYGPIGEAGGYLGASTFSQSFVSLLNALCGVQPDACQ